jgi:dihydrofolate synthase / folylpolyglutamate synthase
MQMMGMLSTKDHEDIFTALLRSGDELHLVSVPDHSSAVPKELATLARQVCPQLINCQTYPDLATALSTLWKSDRDTEPLVVVCGSLYLIGHLLRQLE